MHKRDTPPYSINVAERGKKKYSVGKALEAIFENEDSNDDQFYCGSDAEIVPDSAESKNDSDLDSQIAQIISNLDLEDEANQEDFEHDKTTQFEAAKLPGR